MQDSCLGLDGIVIISSGTTYAICWFSIRHLPVQDRLISYCCLQPAILLPPGSNKKTGTSVPHIRLFCTQYQAPLYYIGDDEQSSPKYLLLIIGFFSFYWNSFWHYRYSLRHFTVQHTAFAGTRSVDSLCSAPAAHTFASSHTYVRLQPNIRKQAPLYPTSGSFVPKCGVLCTKSGSGPLKCCKVAHRSGPSMFT